MKQELKDILYNKTIDELTFEEIKYISQVTQKADNDESSKFAFIPGSVLATIFSIILGCGTGNFVQACKESGWNITGVEPDQGARQVASDRTRESIFQNIFEPEIAHQKYDIITMWHVLEHVHLLDETIAWLKAHLKPGGEILIAVPNPESHDAKKYGEFWAAYDVPRHLYHFTEKTMKTLMQKHNLKVEAVLPMWFDSFYVSMLSTKYQSGATKMIDSMLTGLISNVKGKGNTESSTNTSSLIYLISTK